MASFLGLFILVVCVQESVSESESRVVSYSAELYNEMLDYKIAREYAFEYDHIRELGDIFMKHEMNDTFGLCLLHNHFHLEQDEILIEIVSNDTSHVSVDLIENHKADVAGHKTKTSIAISKKDIIKPYLYEISSDSHLIPMEYVDVTYSNFGVFNNVTKERFNTFDLSFNNELFGVFLNEMVLKLESIDRLGIFGLCMKHRQSINEIDPFGSTLETNHPTQRWLHVEPMYYHSLKSKMFEEKWKKKEASSTFWSFPLKCDTCPEGVSECAECACGGGRCAECGCFI